MADPEDEVSFLTELERWLDVIGWTMARCVPNPLGEPEKRRGHYLQLAALALNHSESARGYAARKNFIGVAHQWVQFAANLETSGFAALGPGA